MIDSPYEFDDLALRPASGALVGLSAALVMLAIVALLEPLSALPTSRFLTTFGTMIAFWCRPECGAGTALGAGLALHGAVGAILGTLYAASQQRIPPRGLLAVGAFYGVVLWAVGGFIIGSALGEEVRTLVRTWPWLTATISYGLVLGGTAAFTELRSRRTREIVQPD